MVPADAELSARPDWIEAWDEVDDERRRLYARMMEVYAGFVSHTDHHIGRVLDHLESTGELDNTVVVVISDNGASPEGGPHGTWNVMQQYVKTRDDDSLDAEFRPYGRTRRFHVLHTTIRGPGPGRATPRSAAGSATPSRAASVIR